MKKAFIAFTSLFCLQSHAMLNVELDLTCQGEFEKQKEFELKTVNMDKERTAMNRGLLVNGILLRQGTTTLFSTSFENIDPLHRINMDSENGRYLVDRVTITGQAQSHLFKPDTVNPEEYEIEIRLKWAGQGRIVTFTQNDCRDEYGYIVPLDL